MRASPQTAVISPELRYQIGRALEEFPELGDRKVTVGLTATPGIDGLAVADEMLVRLNVNRRRVPYFTIGHELMHRLQRPGLGIVPAGEVLCDIWTAAQHHRDELQGRLGGRGENEFPTTIC